MVPIRSLLAAAVLAAMPATIAIGQSVEEITVRNRSGMTLVNFWASAQSNQSWEAELLGTRVLASGRNYTMRIRNVADCNYDFRMEFADGSVVTDLVDICAVNEYTITP